MPNHRPTSPDLSRLLDVAHAATTRLLAAARTMLAGPTAQSPDSPGGLGIDVEDIERWRHQRRLSDHFSGDEMTRAASHVDPAPHYAGWWAAREAAVKALAGEGITVRQVRVAHDEEGRPSIVVPDRDDLTAQLLLSISHSDTTAVAVVVRR